MPQNRSFRFSAPMINLRRSLRFNSIIEEPGALYGNGLDPDYGLVRVVIHKIRTAWPTRRYPKRTHIIRGNIFLDNNSFPFSGSSSRGKHEASFIS